MEKLEHGHFCCCHYIADLRVAKIRPYEVRSYKMENAVRERGGRRGLETLMGSKIMKANLKFLQMRFCMM